MIARSADSQEMLEYAKKTQGMRSLMDSAIDDFLKLYAVALKSRELQQEDMKQAVMAAISELFGN